MSTMITLSQNNWSSKTENLTSYSLTTRITYTLIQLIIRNLIAKSWILLKQQKPKIELSNYEKQTFILDLTKTITNQLLMSHSSKNPIQLKLIQMLEENRSHQQVITLFTDLIDKNLRQLTIQTLLHLTSQEKLKLKDY